MRRCQRDHFEELDGYRGLAALMVAISHVHILQLTTFGSRASGGVLAGLTLGNFDAGVDCFFVLSGLLIFLPFARAYVTQGSVPALRAFLLRRAARIIPAYYCVLAIVWFITSRDDNNWGDLLAHLSFAHIFSERYIFTLVGPGWSVAVEMIFYLLVGATAPAVYRLCGIVATPQRRAMALLGACATLLLASVVYKLMLTEPLATLFFGPLARADNFILGMGLAVALAAPSRESRIGPRGAWWLRVAALLLGAVTFLARFQHPLAYLIFHTACGLAFTLLLASTIFGPGDARWVRWLACPPLRFLGMISYGIYLWHSPLLTNLARRGIVLRLSADALWPNIALLLVLTLALATAGYYLIERPVLRAARHLSTRDTVPTAHSSTATAGDAARVAGTTAGAVSS